MLRIVCYFFPPKGGDLPSWCVSLRGRKRIVAHEVIVVVVVVAAAAVVVVVVVVVVVGVVEYMIILIIIIVVLIDFAQLQLCQTVHLESSFFSNL